MRTRLTELLDIELPIMLAGMGGVSYHELVAAVSEAGGIGTLGASTMSAEQLVEEMALVRQLTKKPFGVDLLTASPGSVEAGVAAVISGGARIYVAGLGVPREVIGALHKNGILVGSMCGKVRHAIAAVATGCDFVVAQGTEAGGHTGTVATMALVPQVVDAVGDKVPVVAAGGLFDGRGLAAALALGADGVWNTIHRHSRSTHCQRIQRNSDRAYRRRNGHQPRIHWQDLSCRAKRMDTALRRTPRRTQVVS